MSAVAFGCRCLLIGVFAVSAFTKLRNGPALRAFADSLVGMRLVPSRWARAVAAAVAGAELALLVLLCTPGAEVAGFGAAAAMLVALSAGIGWSLARGAAAPCRCFGASQRPLGRAHLVRNGALLAVAGTGAVAALLAPGPVPAAGAVLALLLAAAGLGAVVFFEDFAALFARTGVAR